jgi:surface antigen
MLKIICLTLVSISLTACTGAGPKQTAGQLLGGVTGAVIGSQFGKGTGQLVGVALGTMAGSTLGGMIGQKLDAQDRAMAQRTMIDTLEHAPDHQSRGWNNPNSKHSGKVLVTKTQEIPQNNLVCRDYVHAVIIDGHEEKAHGRACRDVRDPQASWMIQ